MPSNKSGKHQMITGAMELFWHELKTMNMMKMKSLYKIARGYIRMKYFAPKRIEKRRERRDIEATYRITR